jgi:hypothetical protein
LIDKVYAPRTLWAAWQRVAANQGAAGIDRMSIERFASHAERYLTELAEALRSNAYQPSPVRRVHIPKGHGKTRPLGIATVKDRVVQTALKLVMEPIFEKDFRPVSYGFRPERGCKDALRVVQQALKEGYTWVVDADLQSYFDTIPKEPLLALVRERVSDGRILALVRAFLDQEVMDGLERWTPIAGTAQGSALSPLLSNLYLHGLDERMSQLGIRYVRFADDRVPRRRRGGRKSSVQPGCTRAGGWPPEAGVQAQASNHRLRLPVREVVVSETGKGWGEPSQVRIVELNASEPLMTCRKRREDVETRGESLTWDKPGRSLCMAQAASGMKAARRRSRLLCGRWEPVTPMPREKRKGQPPECESTEAGYRGGATRSSDEGPVMGLERRGGPIRPGTRGQLATGGLS